MNDYYYHGWPVEDIRFDITQNNRECGLHQYLSSSAKRNQTSIESRLYYVVGSEESAAIDRLMFLSSESSRLYIHGIEQPTSGLEKYFDYAYDALQTESYDDLTSAIAHIAKEQLRLSSMQIDDITLMIAEHEKSIIDMTLIGSFYKLNQQQGVSSVAGIADSRIPLLQKYSEISNVRDTVISSLDQKIVNRGGVVTDGKRIVIAVRKQRLYMIENYRIIYDMPISTGIYGHQTGLGEFQVYEKVPMAWGYYRIWMPYWLTIYYSGDLENGIHGIPISPSTGRWDRWDNAVGNYPITYGCVMPHDWDAKTLFEWAEVGIPVSILP